MTDSNAERLDPSVLGEEVGDAGRPGDEFPPDTPLGVEDPAIVADGMIARDDVASRDERLADGDVASHADRPGPGLVDPAGGGTPQLDDTEQQLVADTGADESGPEAAAIRVVED